MINCEFYAYLSPNIQPCTLIGNRLLSGMIKQYSPNLKKVLFFHDREYTCYSKSLKETGPLFTLQLLPIPAFNILHSSKMNIHF